MSKKPTDWWEKLGIEGESPKYFAKTSRSGEIGELEKSGKWKSTKVMDIV